MPTVRLPTLHPGQVEAFNAGYRFMGLRCGRRWGKTAYGITRACDGATKKWPVGFFAPDYKIIAETFQEIRDILDPIITRASQQRGVIRTLGGGRIDFWSLDNPRAGRSRKYKLAIIDEAAYTKPNMINVWEQNIRPTLVDLRGTAIALSNTAGADPENFLHQICTQPGRYGFRDFHAPSHANPYLPRAELADLERKSHPLVWRQEYLAEFVDWSGSAFFDEQKLLEFGKPVEFPAHCDSVFAVIDTAVKDGKAHDGTAVSYWARSRFAGHPLVLLDWDIVQMEGALLETWLPGVFTRCEALAAQCGARQGVAGVWIEDKASGTILLQQAQRRGWNAIAIEGAITSAGKDGRAINVSGYVHQGQVKFSRHAYDKVAHFKNVTRNHMLTQVLSFRVGDKSAATRSDDLLDTFCYGIAISLGNGEGY
jgi:phage terminase large subunit-like protein